MQRFFIELPNETNECERDNHFYFLYVLLFENENKNVSWVNWSIEDSFWLGVLNFLWFEKKNGLKDFMEIG
jgi:hypothetical protein